MKSICEEDELQGHMEIWENGNNEIALINSKDPDCYINLFFKLILELELFNNKWSSTSGCGMPQEFNMQNYIIQILLILKEAY